MLLGVIADDFTGASDIANTLAKGTGGMSGMAVTQYFGIPTKAAQSECEAGVISLKSRSIPAKEAIDLSLAALDWLLKQGCKQIVFKYCSTFDRPRKAISARSAKRSQTRWALTASSPAQLFQQLAARSIKVTSSSMIGCSMSSGLENHPLNPMTDADLRRWLKRQAQSPVGLVPWTLVRKGAAAIKMALAEAAQRGYKLVIVDALSEDDLLAIGKACAEMPLITGGSGIAMGLPQNFAIAGKLSPGKRAWQGIRGPEAALAGSCSAATRRQVERHAARHPVFAIDAEAVLAGTLTPEAIVAFMRENSGRQPLAYSSASPDEVSAIQARGTGAKNQLTRSKPFFERTSRALVESGVDRLVVAGGETSGAAISGLGLEAVTIGPEIDPGVPALATLAPEKVALTLKSGNFGSEDFFEKALDRLEADA